MKSESQARLASTLTALAGGWLLVTPLFISMTGAALTSILISGAIIALAGLAQLTWTENTLPSWISALAAIWLFITAFAYTVSTAAAWNQAITAVVAFVLASWDGVEVSHVRDDHQRHIRV